MSRRGPRSRHARRVLPPPAERLPIVAIVGRPNVGKSTLFNRLIGERRAIVEDLPGVTRDRNYAEAALGDRRVLLVDTGGFDPDASDAIWSLMREQVELAIAEADLVLLMLDTRDGLTPIDRNIHRMLVQAGASLLVLANKADNQKLELEGTAEAYQLGISDVLPISAYNRRNLRKLRDRIVAALPEEGPRVPEQEDVSEEALLSELERELMDTADLSVPDTLGRLEAEEAGGDSSRILLDDDAPIAVAVVGRPNAGKSTLINKLIGDDRHLTSDQPGTTRDSIDSWVLGRGRPYLLIDTAGLRRKSRITDRVERFSALRALESVRRSDVVVLLIDATAGLTDQDKKIATLAVQYGCGVVLVVNKWDLVEKDHRTADHFRTELHGKLPFLDWAPILFISALSGQRTHRLFGLIETAAKNRSRRLSTGALNRLLRGLMQRLQPPISGTRRPKIFFGSQVTVAPPTFLLFGSGVRQVPQAYMRFLESGLRSQVDFGGTPLRLRLRERARSPSKRTRGRPRR